MSVNTNIVISTVWVPLLLYINCFSDINSLLSLSMLNFYLFLFLKYSNNIYVYIYILIILYNKILLYILFKLTGKMLFHSNEFSITPILYLASDFLTISLIVEILFSIEKINVSIIEYCNCFLSIFSNKRLNSNGYLVILCIGLLNE